MTVKLAVSLLQVATKQLVAAQLVTMTPQHANDAQTHWRSVLAQSTEEDRFWDWEQFLRRHLAKPGAEGYALECCDRTQGMILLATRGYRSWVEPQRRVVYVEALATAPWNRSQLQAPQYRLVGGTLMEFARYRSASLGYGGLVGLHSFPNAERFYTQLGLLNCGADPDYDNLIYFEWYRPRPPREDEWDDTETN